MIKFLLIRDVAAPERELGNAGFDFFVPEFNKSFKETCAKEAEKIPAAAVKFQTDRDGKEYISIAPHNRVNIPSGVKSYISLGMPLASYGLEADLIVENKSGISTKRGLDVAACEIDPNYQGEIHLSLTNTTDDYVSIYAGDKITQLVPRIYIKDDAIIKKSLDIDPNGESEETFYDGFKYNNRGVGGFGSTTEKAKK